MSRALFMVKLKKGLAGLPQSEIDEIVSDYEHHFSEANATGQSDDEIVGQLGDPVNLARELSGQREPRQSVEELTPSAAPTSRPNLYRGLALIGSCLIVLGAGAVAYNIVGQNSGVGALGPAASTYVASLAPPQHIKIDPANGARIVVSGNQVLDLGDIAQERIELVLDGGGHVTARGRVKELTLQIDGSGAAELGALQAEIVRVKINGTGNAEVSGTQMAEIEISGSGAVRLKVKPKTLRQTVTGSGGVVFSIPTSPK